MNHSCDPNLWMENEVTLSARRDIAKGEELTADYAMWTTNLLLEGASCYRFECNCSSDLCRNFITADDWKSSALRKRYKDHFSPYINKKIENAQIVNEIIPHSLKTAPKVV